VEFATAEMFSGIGGFRFGLEKSGWKTVWANDNDKYACQIYRKNFGDKELVEADIRTVDPETIPDHTLLTAGFPCPSFSLAGKRKGFQDIRGTLFHEIVRVAQIKRPKLLLLENVKGLLSNDNGKTFATVLESLGNIGYWCEWQTLNNLVLAVPPILHNAKIRRLTPVECERLQGFPDSWTRGVSDTQRYKLLGNAVTTNVVEFLGRRLRECLE